MRAVRPRTSSRLGGMSQIRTSTVPKLWCGRTSHQISRIVLIKPVSIMWFKSQVYSDQFRISGGKTGRRQGLHDLAALRVQAGVPALPERAVDRERQQSGQVLEDSVADHDRLVARVDTDVDVQAEGHQPAGGFLKELNQAEVALVGCDILVLPGRKGMRAPPEKTQIVAAGDLPDDLELFGQVCLDFGDVRTDLAC